MMTEQQAQATEEPELERLRRMYGDTYRVWTSRSGRYWMATALVDDLEPTLMEESAQALEAKLRAPGARIGGPLAPLGADAL